MKNLFLGCILSAILFNSSLAGLAVAAGTAQDGQRSLLSNGNFARASKGANWPANWPHPRGATWEKHGQAHFLRLKSSHPGQMILLYRRVYLPSPPPAALELRLRVRYSGVKVGTKNWFDARIMGHFKNAKGQTLKPDPILPSFHGSSKGWVDKSYFLKVPPSTQFLEIMPCLFRPAAGRLDFAKIQVFTATAAQLPKPPPIIPSQTMPLATLKALPPELHVMGNHLQITGGKTVWLQGLCVDSLEWSDKGEHILKSIKVAIDQWHANVIRLPVARRFWFGLTRYQHDGGLAYRRQVDSAIRVAAARRAYLVLDLHGFGAPMPGDVIFWKDAATRYKSNPAVIFELFNEPHGITWKIWRNGGVLTDPAHNGEVSVGMQALVDAVRQAGARNLLIAGGLHWGYDLAGVVHGYALHGGVGDGIMYSSHLYPWKTNWQKNTLDAAAQYPIFVGEVGCPPSYKPFKFIPLKQRHPLQGWAKDVLGLIQKYKLNWTGFSFHPRCAPMIISDWKYTPTPYWGVYVKAALSGRLFNLKKLH